MLQPLQRATRGQRATVQSVPPPVGGLNTRDALDQMKPEDAVALLNLFPTASDVRTRGGSAEHCDTADATTSVKTLMELHAGTVRKLIAITNGKAYDVTSSSPSTLKTGLTAAGDRWEHTNFKGALHLCNGVDAPQKYDGSTWSAPSWSGVTLTTLNNIHSHQSRIYFAQANSQSVWYGGTDSVSGTLTEFPLGALGRFGGNLEAIGSITEDGGVGGRDLICFFMGSGEVIIYSGSDPGSNFVLVGVFNIGSPIGKRSVTKVGADLVVITEDGYVPLTTVLPFGRVNDSGALSDKISQTVSDAITSFNGNNGFQSTLYPRGDMILFNVPESATVFKQHVMNTTTGAWTIFDSWNGECFSIFNDELYFGGAAGVVYKADTGTADSGAAIIADAATAWNYFGSRGRLKKFNNVRPNFLAGSNLPVSLRLNTDFDDQLPTAVSSGQTSDIGGVYGTGVYGTAVYGGGESVRNDWQSVTGIGYAASLRFRAVSATQGIKWNASTYTYEMGGII